MEVGPRDGLQNEKTTVTLEQKVRFIGQLAAAGLKEIEAGAFVSPKWVPQMASSAQVIKQTLESHPGCAISALVPNAQGMQEALDVGLKHVAVFTTVSETFSRKNTNCSISESLERIQQVLDLAKERGGVRVRAYVSCIAECPYEGRMDYKRVRDLTRKLLEMGCTEVSLGDTIGVATPQDIRLLFSAFKKDELSCLAGHFHDTYGMGVGNVLASVEMGVRTVDASVAGLGGCPYAPGAAGNVATEEVVYLLNGLGLNPGVDLSKLLEAGAFISDIVKRPPSKLALAMMSKKRIQ